MSLDGTALATFGLVAATVGLILATGAVARATRNLTTATDRLRESGERIDADERRRDHGQRILAERPGLAPRVVAFVWRETDSVCVLNDSDRPAVISDLKVKGHPGHPDSPNLLARPTVTLPPRSEILVSGAGKIPRVELGVEMLFDATYPIGNGRWRQEADTSIYNT